MTSPIVPNRFIVHGNMVVKDRATGQDVTVRVADFIEAMKQRDEIRFEVAALLGNMF